MKTQKMISIKNLTNSLLLVVLLLSIAACGGAQENKESKPKAPGMNIHTAAFMGNVEAIKQHIKAGTDLNQKDEYGSSALTIAATFNKVEVAKALINGGADLSVRSADGSTPLHTAAFFCRVEIVKALLDKGADKTLKNSYGSTPLQTVSVPFAAVKGIYDQVSKDLGPLGFKLDYNYLETTRPKVAKLLQ